MEKTKKIAILTEKGFEQSELTSPKEALEQAGFTVDVIAPEEGTVRAWNHTGWGIDVTVDKKLADAHTAEYDMLILPGGVLNPDKLRMNETAVQFVETFLQTHKPVAAICHGPQTLIETGMLEGKRMTSYPSLRTDLKNAGVDWIDDEVVQDGNLITSRSPEDLPAFNKKLIEVLQSL